MRRSKYTNWGLIAAFALVLALASSWYGAVLYVRHYPNIIEYLEPMALLRPDGNPLGPVSSSHSTPFVMHARARRQPYHCWGTYVYYLDNEKALYQFPTVRSVGLSNSVHEVIVRNAFTIPAGLSVGTYRLKVTIFPSCDGMEITPPTLDLGVDVTVVP